MKKLLKLSIIVTLILVCWVSTAYVQPKCTVTLETSTSDYKRGDTVTFDVNFSNIVSDNGIIGVEAVLEYDKSVLTLESMKRTK